ncbi:MAG: prolyl oligopeptidase family serine peptidase [Rhodospirillales bacterium]|nr:prolyl oligopeptidase family serine peptidase [Rhodospirillales bacterium]
MNDPVELHGPTFAPASGAAPKQLVILCHGVGSDGQDLIGLAPYFAKVLPDAQFVSPNAPYAFDMAPVGYQWFSLDNPTPESRLAGTQAAAPILNAFIDSQMQAYGLTDTDVALIGFSQGSMMALHVGVRRQRPLAAIVAYSGALIGPELVANEVKSQPPILMMHGSTDDVVPPDALYEGVAVLQAAGLNVKGEIVPNLGHGLNDQSILAGMAFLAESFGVPLPEPTPLEQPPVDP